MKIFSFFKLDCSPTIHPKEDYSLVSKKYPIFVVADGVSLNQDKGEKYPEYSGAAEVAKIFCETVLEEAEKRFDNFIEKDLKEIFEIGNDSIREYNISQGRTKDTINYWDFDLFSATTSFALIKNSKIYWWSLCDSGVAIYNAGRKVFQSPNGWINFPKDWIENRYDREKVIFRHKDYRNAVNNGKLIGYGAVDGEEAVTSYLNYGVKDINKGETILIFTDGFENYFGLENFIDIFKLWPEDVENKLENIVLEKSKENPDKYGREKTLIAISV